MLSLSLSSHQMFCMHGVVWSCATLQSMSAYEKKLKAKQLTSSRVRTLLKVHITVCILLHAVMKVCPKLLLHSIRFQGWLRILPMGKHSPNISHIYLLPSFKQRFSRSTPQRWVNCSGNLFAINLTIICVTLSVMCVHRDVRWTTL